MISARIPGRIPATIPARISAWILCRISARIPAKIPARIPARIPSRIRGRIRGRDSGKDPFRLHKREALDKALEGPFHNVAKACAGNYEDGLNFEAFRKLLLYDLWGNRADLSLSAGQVSESDDICSMLR